MVACEIGTETSLRVRSYQSQLAPMLTHIVPTSRLQIAVSAARETTVPPQTLARPQFHPLRSSRLSLASSGRQSRSLRKRKPQIYRCFSVSSNAWARTKNVILEDLPDENELNDQDLIPVESTLPLHCVFKVLAVETPPNYFIPWQKKSSKDCIGSGFVVKTPFGVKLLTNAHVVENATTVRIRRSGSQFMYAARVNAIANECDLAELVVDDPAFWKEANVLEALNLADLEGEASLTSSAPATSTLRSKKQKTSLKHSKTESTGTADTDAKSVKSKKSKRSKKSSDEVDAEEIAQSALEMGALPELHSKVTVIGYPTGGDNVSVTRGVVSRIEPQSYTETPGNELLAIQIDAAINPGNSGGPALDDEHRVVGVAFCSLQGAENIGYIIPTPIILHFLEDIHRNKGQYTGFVRLGLITQSLDQNPAACEYFKLKPRMSGLLVANVDAVGDANGKVLKDDVLLAVEGTPLANDGTVPFRRRERIHFEYLLMQKFKDDQCRLTVWRAGKEVELEIKVKPKILELVPSHASNPVPNPPYLIYGGLVFTKLSFAYLAEYGDDWYNAAPRELLYQAFHTKHLREGQEIVILSQVLVDDCNFGYNRLSNLSLKKVNGVEVENLLHLHKMIQSNENEFLRFDLDENVTVVIKHEQALAAIARIQLHHGVPKLSSFEPLAEVEPQLKLKTRTNKKKLKPGSLENKML